MTKGPIRVPAPDPIEEMLGSAAAPETVELPANEILDAGVAKFMELANLHWPTRGLREGFLLTSFDIRDSHKLRMTLGLTYMAMKEANHPGYVAFLEDIIRDLVISEGMHIPKGCEHLFKDHAAT